MTDTEPTTEELTDRDLDVLVAFARGCTLRQIAAQHDVGPNTVKWWSRVVLSKLRAVDRANAVTRGVARGLLLIHPSGHVAACRRSGCVGGRHSNPCLRFADSTRPSTPKATP